MAFVFSPNALVTPAFAESIYGDPSAIAPAKKAIIETTVNAASDQIARYCDRNFVAQNYVETQDGAVNDELMTRQYPILAVTEVLFSLNGRFAESTPLEPSSYGTDGNTIVLLFTRTARGRRSVRVSYRAGYETLPYDLMIACCQQAKYLESRTPIDGKAPVMLGLQSMSKGDESITKDSSIRRTGFTADVLGIIDGYRRVEAPFSQMFPRGEL